MLKIENSSKHQHGSGGFGIDILWPGMVQNSDDSGIGAIGRIDQANVKAGTVISMHPHKDDEILTYMRQGRMLHLDTETKWSGKSAEGNWSHRKVIVYAGLVPGSFPASTRTGRAE